MTNFPLHDYSCVILVLPTPNAGARCVKPANCTIGKPAGKNPWKANSLEWHTSTVPPEHGNFGEKLPVVHRWPYDYSVPGAKEDFIPQTTPPSEVADTEIEKT